VSSTPTSPASAAQFPILCATADQRTSTSLYSASATNPIPPKCVFPAAQVLMAETYSGLQTEYLRVMRTAELARSLAKQHALRASDARRALEASQRECATQAALIAELQGTNQRLRQEQAASAEQLAMAQYGRADGLPGAALRAELEPAVLA
jgi:hypothetical protein